MADPKDDLESDPNLSRRGALLRILELGACVAGATILTSGTTEKVAQARRPPPPVEPQRPLVSLGLESPEGAPLPHFDQGRDRWVAGFEGERYNLRVTNHSPKRVEVVVTVDGRDVISGHLGDYVKQRGYVLDPFATLVIEGYRQSMDNVAAFRFSALGDSYTARMGSAFHAGVVGVAAFSEYELPHRHRRPLAPTEGEPFPGEDSGRPAPPAVVGGMGGRLESRGARKRDSWAAEDVPDSGNDLGTEYGESQYAPVEEVTFKRKRRKRPEQIVVLRYDSMDGLRERGILTRPEPRPRPDRTWREPDRDFAPPPPPRSRGNWRDW